jgi:hypothetical protein
MLRTTLNRRAFLAPALLAGLVPLAASRLPGQETPKPSSPLPAPAGAGTAPPFSAVADQALAAMTKRAEELHVKGVAVVACIEGDTVNNWSSKMRVVGSMKNPPSDTDKGANLLGIAYAKAAEMADSLKDSGNAGRPPMTGEYGWQGGVVAKGKTGHLIAAFSGGPSEDDVRISRAGLQVLAASL